LVGKAKKFNQQVVLLSRNPGNIYLIKAHKTLLLILKISFFQQKMNPQTTHSLKEGTTEIIYLLGQNLGWTKSSFMGTQFNQLPNWVGTGGNKKTTKNNNNNNWDQTNISTHMREGGLSIFIPLQGLKCLS
jgi:hypothetical protein